MAVETTTTGASAIDQARIAALTEREMAKLAERTPASKERYERAVKVMPKGVPSSFQENDPWPVYVERGAGTRVWDVDGHEYIDFHNGFGVMCIGHANPTVGAAVKARVDLGTHFAAPTTARSWSPRSSPAASAFRSGGSQTPAPSRPWTRSIWLAAPPVAM